VPAVRMPAVPTAGARAGGRVALLLLAVLGAQAASAAADGRSGAAASPMAAPAPVQRWQAGSEGGHFRGTLGPRQGPVRFGAFQDWVLTLLDTDGGAVYPARIGVGGGMPGHGHGLPTQPAVTDYLGDGRYRIEGMKLSMSGRWLLVFAIETPSARDRIVFDVVVDY
jgi:hypothetical protein